MIVDTVTNAYKTYLNREPEAEGFLYWTKRFYEVLNKEGLEAANYMIRQGFINSEEYKNLNK